MTPKLLKDVKVSVGAVEGIRRVRFTSPHPKDLRPEVIAAMKPKRQTLFRGVWTAFGEGERSNKYYSEANHAV